MFKKDQQKHLTALILACLLLALFISSVPAVRTPALNIFKLPFSILTLIRQEFEAIIFYRSNYQQLNALRKDTDFLKNKINVLREAQSENERLKKLLSFKQETAYKVIASKVIARSADNWSSAVIVDKGSYHGIRRGMAAVNYLGFVGRVIEVSKYTSKILLISDPGLGVSALCQRSRQEGLVSGTLGAYLMMRYLPQDADIKTGDTIITSGLSAAYPKGLLIGTVNEIGREFSGLSSYAVIAPAAGLSGIEEVLVIIQ